MKKHRLLIANISGEYRKVYSKSLHLKPGLIEFREFNKTYDEYIAPSLLYFTEDFQEIAKKLNVKKVIPMGQYIRGLFGGETGRGEPYAGLVLEEHKYINSEFVFRLYGTSSKLCVPRKWLDKYHVDVYELIYVGMIYPFRLANTLPVLLSEQGPDNLRLFLKKTLETYARDIASKDAQKIRALISELKQPSSPEKLQTGLYYVVYRCDRAFTACFVKPTSSKMILDSHVSAIECSNEDKAHYYVAILNYLAYKVITEKRSFIHHQFARPALAIIVAGLGWNDIDENIRNQIAEKSRKISQKTPIKESPNQRVALNRVVKYPEFKEIVKLLDEHINREYLEEALNLVSGKRKTLE